MSTNKAEATNKPVIVPYTLNPQYRRALLDLRIAYWFTFVMALQPLAAIAYANAAVVVPPGQIEGPDLPFLLLSLRGPLIVLSSLYFNFGLGLMFRLRAPAIALICVTVAGMLVALIPLLSGGFVPGWSLSRSR